MHGAMTATGYRFGNVAYLTDLSRIPEASMDLLAGVEVLIIDALRYTPHANHLNIEGALRVVERLRPRRALFTHLTHEVPYSDGKNLPVGVEFAYDGLKLEAT
jgi:phosphoribosyl 1,2-cyclic phosphate phosphodiesterase